MSFISHVETWITKSEQSDDGWATIKPFLFVKLTTSDGIAVSYTHLRAHET